MISISIFPSKKDIFIPIEKRDKEFNTVLSCSLRFKHLIFFSILRSKGISIDESIIDKHFPLLNIVDKDLVLNNYFIPLCDKVSLYINRLKELIIYALRTDDHSILKRFFKENNYRYLINQYQKIVKSEDKLSSLEKNDYFYNMIDNFIFYNMSKESNGLTILEKLYMDKGSIEEIKAFFNQA